MGGGVVVVVARAAAAAAELTMYIARETSKVSFALDSITEAALLIPLDFPLIELWGFMGSFLGCVCM